MQTEKCPIDHSKLSKDELEKLKMVHGVEIAEKERKSSSVPSEPGKCPIDHKNMSKEELTGFMSRHKKLLAKPAPDVSSLPADSDHKEKSSNGETASREHRPAYDVYGQEINQANMMPAVPNQLPSPGQVSRLSTERVSSTIPKSETDGRTWTYPSPQMFFNALKRKGKADDVDESDMESVVAIHNSMNERAWREIEQWERKYHCSQCSQPKLRKFSGKPNDLSPAARFRTLCRGYPQPFDRHDWIVDRCGTEDARYIIDYYHHEDRKGGDPIEIHVRPAMDSFGAVWDRARNRFGVMVETIAPSVVGSPQRANTEQLRSNSSASAAAKPGTAPSESLEDEEFNFLKSLTPDKIRSISDDIQRDCAKFGEMLSRCGDNVEACEQANVALNYCMADKICRPQANAFMRSVESGSGSEVTAYEEMSACLQRFTAMTKRVLLQASRTFETGPEQ